MHASNLMTSIDPAIQFHDPANDVASFDQLNIVPGDVYIFDFDGVISSRFEDDIYRLPATSDEVELVASAAVQFGIRCDQMEQRYQRHLIYQAAAWKLNMPIEPGPGFEKAKLAGDISHLFILTARSGWHAVERFRAFLKDSGVKPIETYNVGRVIKDRQVELICREFSAKRIAFVEDSPTHLQAVAKHTFNNLRLYLLKSNVNIEVDDASLRKHFSETVVAALSAP
jgi:hypothetical protein